MGSQTTSLGTNSMKDIFSKWRHSQQHAGSKSKLGDLQRREPLRKVIFILMLLGTGKKIENFL